MGEDQEGILWCKKGGFINAPGWDLWTERAAALGLWGWLVISTEAGGGKETGGFQKGFSYVKEPLPLSS